MLNEQSLNLTDAYVFALSDAVGELDQSGVAESDPGKADLFGDAFTAIGDAEWMDDALCAQTDAESFYPEKGGSARAAKKTCERCLVRAECLDWALTNDERFGVWGGLTDQERQALKTLPSTPLPDSPEGAAA